MRNMLFCVTILVSVALVGCSDQSRLTLFLVGDSTMANYRDTIITPIRGWGQVLPTFLNENVVVRNHAKDGRSTKSFIEEGRWDRVMKKLGNGDVVVIQFGHNDAFKNIPSLYSNPKEYAENLGLMIRQVKLAGAFPILCTPIARRIFIDDSLQYIHGDYPLEAKNIAKKENVPLVDMTTITMDWISSLGEENSRPYFVYQIAPGEYKLYPNGKKDNTHLRLKGALEVARLFAEAVEAQEIKPLCNYITAGQKGVKYTKFRRFKWPFISRNDD